MYLLRFDFTLQHILGAKIGKIDGLSKRLDWKLEVEKDNENQILIQALLTNELDKCKGKEKSLVDDHIKWLGIKIKI